MYRRTGFVSQLSRFLAVGTKANRLTALRLSFLIRETGMMETTSQDCCEDSTCLVHEKAPGKWLIIGFNTCLPRIWKCLGPVGFISVCPASNSE